MTISLQNFEPEETQYVSPTFIVLADIISDGDPIDLSTINVYFTGNLVISAGTILDGYNSYIDAIDYGFRISIDPSAVYRNTAVNVSIEADTIPSSGVISFERTFSTANHIGFASVVSTALIGTNIIQGGNSYSGSTFTGRNNNILFQLNSIEEPVITNRIPVVNSSDSPRNTNISFFVHDNNQEGILITTLTVYINDDLAIFGGAFVFPFTGTIQAASIDGFDGFSVLIDTSNYGLFPFSSIVQVRVIVQDAVTDPSARNTLDVTYQFFITDLIDLDEPGAELTLPSTGLGLEDCIEFDWLDAPVGSGTDLSTLDVTLRREIQTDCITSITDDIAVVDGIATSGYTLFATAIEIGDQVGYHIIICPKIPFNELETIEVVIQGEDSQGNSSTISLSISTAETSPPEILNILPIPESTDVASDAVITFDMHDSSGTGVAVDRLIVKIDDGEAVIDGVVQSGYTFGYEQDTIIDTFGLQFDGYHFSVSRDIPFDPGKEIAVEIDGYDGYNNLATEVFFFTVAPDTIPPYVMVSPANGDTGLSRDTFITVQVRDILGVDKSTVDISVQGNPAVIGGVSIPPFDVYITETESSPGVADGYQFVIDTENDFGFNERVYVDVNGDDLFGNSVSTRTSFTIYNETTPPVISGMAPRDGQEEVSRRPDIEFIVRDGYDIDYRRLNVSVNGDAAILDGVVQPFYQVTNYRLLSGYPPGVEPGDGYHVVIHPQYDFDYNSTVGVAVLAFDLSQGNSAYQEANWDIIRPRPPLYDMIPTPDQEDVGLDTNIWFEVFDDGYDIDISTLQVSIDGIAVISNNVIQGPDYVGAVSELDAYQHYAGVINPRFILEPDKTHTISISARENVSGNFSQSSYTFNTTGPLENPKTVYLGDSNGVQSVIVDSISGSTVTSSYIDGYYVHDIQAKELKYVNRLLVATQDSGAILLATNYTMNPLFYSVGDNIVRASMTTNNNGTLYLANHSRERIDVYYNVLYDDVGRNTPDAYYGADGYALEKLDDGYFTDMVVTEGTSTVIAGSNSIFLGTPSGVFRIETDESDPGATEINGEITTYGVGGSGGDHEILDGQTNYVVAIDVNVRLNHLYVATRSPYDEVALTYINLEDNSFAGSIPEDRLINRLINNISFEDPE